MEESRGIGREKIFSRAKATVRGADPDYKTVVPTVIKDVLVETDSPYLAPSPYRGKSNEPSYIVHTVEKLSEIKNISKEDVITNTTNNFKKLFSLT